MSPDSTLMVIVAFGIAGIFWTLVAVAIWLLGRRLPRVTGGLALACAAVVVARLNANTTDYTAYWRQEHVRVDSLHQAFAPALEAYRHTHGRYPSALREAGIKTPRTLYGPLRYDGSGNERPSWYRISFGGPGEQGFTAVWDSRKRAWSITELNP